MMGTEEFMLPAGLPLPLDDGACDHLVGTRLPPIPLRSSRGGDVNLANHRDKVLLYVYPATGVPSRPLPEGWNATPGARGCTPQSCAYRDLHDDFKSRNIAVMGLSAQPSEEQEEAASRLNLPYPLLCDSSFRLADAIGLPTFELGGARFLKRATLVIEAGVIVHVHYPVFPPNEDASHMLEWLVARAAPRAGPHPGMPSDAAISVTPCSVEP